MVEHRRFGRPRRAYVVVARDRVQHLRAHASVIEQLAALFDQPQPEMHVAEQAALVGRPEHRAAAELERAPDVVHERRREQQVDARSR